MEHLPFPRLYRPAAILAAFSRISDDVASGASPTLVVAGQLERDSLLWTIAETVRRVLNGVASMLRFGAGSRSKCEAPSILATALPMAAAGEAMPALASHFDLRPMVEDVELLLQSLQEQRAA